MNEKKVCDNSCERGRAADMDSLPVEIVEEILSKFSIKLLLRIRCVSKSWLSIISSPYFDRLHLKRNPNRSMRMFMSAYHERPALVLFDYEAYPFGRASAFKAVEFAVGTNTLNYNVRVLGSCNGFVCVASTFYHIIYILNPTTGAYKRLPNSLDNPVDVVYNIGFGYDESTDDYKVYLSFSQTNCGIFSLRKNSWSFIQEPKPRGNFRGVFVNGALHFQGDEGKILAFELATERHSEILYPAAASASRHPFPILGALKGYLTCTLIGDGDLEMTSTWVLKNQSWIEFIRVPQSYLGGLCSYPLCKTKGGDILYCESGGVFRKLHSENKACFYKHNSVSTVHPALYVESLVSPNQFTEEL